MARRGLSSKELQKKRDKFFTRTDSAVGRTKNSNNNKVEVKSSKTKSGKPKTKAQMMATKNIKKYGGTSKAAAANKEAMRLKIKKKYQESKKKKK